VCCFVRPQGFAQGASLSFAHSIGLPRLDIAGQQRVFTCRAQAMHSGRGITKTEIPPEPIVQWEESIFANMDAPEVDRCEGIRCSLMQKEEFKNDTALFANLGDFKDQKLALGGHRGMGANLWDANGPIRDMKRTAYRENTISSFIAAAEAGATFVEFDVQVTSDNVPVLFHDNYLVYGDSENPLSTFVKDLPLQHFKNAAPINSCSCSELGSLAGLSDDEVTSTVNVPWPMLGDVPSDGTNCEGASPRSRSEADGGSPRWGFLMRQHKNDTPATASEKSLSLWEVENDDEFPTLLEVFEQVPSQIAFDIEIKMTTPDNMERTPNEEIERIVGATLQTISEIEKQVEREGKPHRDLVFSSFDPDVCTAVKLRRPHNKVMFLSDGGRSPHVDRRRTSIEAAIRFAAETNLDGIILDSQSLFFEKEGVQKAHSCGLHVMTYGVENDNELWVKEQQLLGVHGVIVDDVPRIASFYSVP